MLTSPDFKELLSLLEKHKVRYLVVGGYAVMKYIDFSGGHTGPPLQYSVCFRLSRLGFLGFL